MRFAAMTGAAMAALAAGAIATPSFAQYDPCHAEKHSNGTAGAVVGGIAGALLGSSLAPHHENRAGGAVIGGVAGAVAGNAIGRSSAENSEACREARANGYYYAPSAGYYAAPTSAYAPSGYYDRDGYWHPYAVTRGYYDSYGNWIPY
jgi:hypothetical protein